MTKCPKKCAELEAKAPEPTAAPAPEPDCIGLSCFGIDDEAVDKSWCKNLPSYKSCTKSENTMTKCPKKCAELEAKAPEPTAAPAPEPDCIGLSCFGIDNNDNSQVNSNDPQFEELVDVAKRVAGGQLKYAIFKMDPRKVEIDETGSASDLLDYARDDGPAFGATPLEALKQKILRSDYEAAYILYMCKKKKVLLINLLLQNSAKVEVKMAFALAKEEIKRKFKGLYDQSILINDEDDLDELTEANCGEREALGDYEVKDAKWCKKAEDSGCKGKRMLKECPNKCTAIKAKAPEPTAAPAPEPDCIGLSCFGIDNNAEMSDSAVFCDVDSDLLKQLMKIKARKESTSLALVMKIDLDRRLVIMDGIFEDIEDVEDIGELIDELIAKKLPRYVVYSINKKLAFIFINPIGTKPDLRMIYAVNEKKVGIALRIRALEIRSHRDFTKELLYSTMT